MRDTWEIAMDCREIGDWVQRERERERERLGIKAKWIYDFLGSGIKAKRIYDFLGSNISER